MGKDLVSASVTKVERPQNAVCLQARLSAGKKVECVFMVDGKEVDRFSYTVASQLEEGVNRERITVFATVTPESAPARSSDIIEA